jgi:hypothetical protein
MRARHGMSEFLGGHFGEAKLSEANGRVEA